MKKLIFAAVVYWYQALVYYRKALKSKHQLKPNIRTLLFQNLAEIHQDQDSIAWYYAQGFDKGLIWIDDLYLYATNTLASYLHNKTNYDSAKYYYDLEHQVALRAVEQRDELKLYLRPLSGEIRPLQRAGKTAGSHCAGKRVLETIDQ